MNAKKFLLSFLGTVVTLAFLAGWEASTPVVGRASMLTGPGCRSASDSFVIDLKDELIDLVQTAPTTDFFSDTVLAVYGVARVAASQIAIVSDSTTCSRAANAYSNAISVSDPNRLVHAIKAGIRYVVIDPSYTPSPYKIGITFDSSFTQTIATFAY